jgi:hypothetical protein
MPARGSKRDICAKETNPVISTDRGGSSTADTRKNKDTGNRNLERQASNKYKFSLEKSEKNALLPRYR